jgi:DNA-binding CsgD family transcriptional regulator
MRTPLRPLVAPSPLLTRREQDVLHGLALGLSNQAIARRLGVSPSTVASHLKGIYRKLGVHSRLEAVRKSEAFHLFVRAPLRRARPDWERPRLRLVASQKSPKEGRKIP